MAKKKGKARNNASTNLNTEGTVSTVNPEAKTTTLCSLNQPVTLKMCRLCESKDGPFLNMFDQGIVDKINSLLPIAISEYDDLPHKICFRCSAKVEELHEFVMKTIRVQESLRKVVGKKPPVNNKVTVRQRWEEYLEKTNTTNEDICNSVVQKALEAIQSVKTIPKGELYPKKRPLRINEPLKNEIVQSPPPKKLRSSDTKEEEPSSQNEIERLEMTSRVTRSDRQKKSAPEDEPLKELRHAKPKTEVHDKPPENVEKQENIVKVQKSKTIIKPVKINPPPAPQKSIEQEPFDFNKHISTIKVNSVGSLFLCKLCNRNFLKHEGVMTHACAKKSAKKTIESGKTDFGVAPVFPPPFVSSVKYINTKAEAPAKTKPKIGPASKVKRPVPDIVGTKVLPGEPKIVPQTQPAQQNTSQPSTSSNFSVISLPNSSYRLIPGPNNTFTLIEDGSKKNSTPEQNVIPEPPITEPKVSKKKRSKPKENTIVPNIEPQEIDKPVGPYPVGLFQTHIPSQKHLQPQTFTTPAMKKQSYTVVQTGNPSKLLISTKPQPQQQFVEQARPKSKKKSKHVPVTNQEYSLEEADRNKDDSFFTFVNVDPLLQPSYVLPTNSFIQEAQVSTTNQGAATSAKPKDLYECSMCPEKFSREKKLLAHIQMHYNKMDEEAEGATRRRNKKMK